MKKLTLDETWTLCLRMWKWIAGQVKESSPLADVIELKVTWLENHGYKSQELHNNCFFCERKKGIGCRNCLARKIDPKFHCMNPDYDYDSKPIPFYAKLVELNKKRLSKKRK